MIYFLGTRDRVEWTDYLDPLTSIGLSFFIAWTALPLVKVGSVWRERRGIRGVACRIL